MLTRVLLAARCWALIWGSALDRCSSFAVVLVIYRLFPRLESLRYNQKGVEIGVFEKNPVPLHLQIVESSAIFPLAQH